MKKDILIPAIPAAVILAGFLFFPSPAAAGEQAAAAAEISVSTQGPATLAVRDLVASAREYADEGERGIAPQEKLRRAAAGKKLSAILNLPGMARLILAGQWDKLKPADRGRYAALLASLVEKIGYPQISKFFKEDLEIIYSGEKAAGDGGTAVLVEILYKNEDLKFSSEFRLRPDNGAWRVYDVITDGESLLLIYRNQHSGIIREKGFAELIRMMEKKLNAK